MGDSFQFKPCSETDCEFAFVIEGPIVDNTGEVTLSPGKKRGGWKNGHLLSSLGINLNGEKFLLAII